MKKLLFASLLALGLGASLPGSAQVRINLSFGTNSRYQPWYAKDNNYYYLPEQGVYYNVTNRMYVYPENGNWYYARTLPSRYNGYTYRQSRYVPLRDVAPFTHHETIVTRYRTNDQYRQREYGGYRRNDHDRRYNEHSRYNNDYNRNDDHRRDNDYRHNR